jgi:hypothetical protein
MTALQLLPMPGLLFSRYPPRKSFVKNRVSRTRKGNASNLAMGNKTKQIRA